MNVILKPHGIKLLLQKCLEENNQKQNIPKYLEMKNDKDLG